MSFSRYERYKDSGFEWLGEVPEHWRISRLGFESWVRARLGWKGLKAEEYVDDGFAFLSTPNIKGRLIDFENVNYINEDRFHESPEIQLNTGDVLLAKDGSTLGTVNVVRHLPRPTTVNGSIAVITPGKDIYGIFLHYLLQSRYLEETIESIKGGMGVPHLFQDDIRKFYLLVPPTNEQFSIADFLDHETAKIDALIQEQQRLIELLKEKRQAVVSRAVTKGLDPTVPTKDSGVEWLERLPSTWQALPLRRCIRQIEQGWSPQAEDRTPSEGGYAVLKLSAVKQGIFDPTEVKALSSEIKVPEKLLLRRGDLLLTRANTPDLVGDSCCVTSDAQGTIFSDLIYRITLDPHFFTHSFVNAAVQSWFGRLQAKRDARGSSSSMVKLGHGHILNWILPVPPIEEQRQIVNYIDRQSTHFGALCADTERAIALLQERRAALISAAVTGKIDVRNYTPRESNDELYQTA